MSEAYRCPICHDNRTHFTFIYKLAQEVHLNAENGTPEYEAPELESLLRPDGRPDVEVRCMRCNYTSAETAFVRRGARRKEQERGRESGRRRQASAR